MVKTSHHHRKSIRLKNYDYSMPGYYFVTICTNQRLCLLGKIENGAMVLNDLGKTVQAVWMDLPKYHSGIELDTFIIMPNHLHGILALNVGATFMAPKQKTADVRQGVMNHAPTLGETIRRFKAVSTRLIHQKGFNLFCWQRNYYEHVIRRDESMEKIREYILGNPLKWDLDENNPLNIDLPKK